MTLLLFESKKSNISTLEEIFLIFGIADNPDGWSIIDNSFVAQATLSLYLTHLF